MQSGEQEERTGVQQLTGNSRNHEERWRAQQRIPITEHREGAGQMQMPGTHPGIPIQWGEWTQEFAPLLCSQGCCCCCSEDHPPKPRGELLVVRSAPPEPATVPRA